METLNAFLIAPFADMAEYPVFFAEVVANGLRRGAA